MGGMMQTRLDRIEGTIQLGAPIEIADAGMLLSAAKAAAVVSEHGNHYHSSCVWSGRCSCGLGKKQKSLENALAPLLEEVEP